MELSDLEMRSLLNITGAGLAALAYGCKRLSELDMKYCVNISNSGFWALAYYSRNLLQVWLFGCNNSLLFSFLKSCIMFQLARHVMYNQLKQQCRIIIQACGSKESER